MTRALSTFLIVTGVMLVLGSPLFVVAWRHKRTTTTRNFLIGALTVGVLCAVLSGVSERQVGQCQSAGNPDCIDSGAVGLQLVMVGIYVLATWIAAASIYRD